MFSLLESALCLWIQVHPLWIQGLKRLVLWTQDLTLLEGQGLWIQTIVLHCSCAKVASLHANPLNYPYDTRLSRQKRAVNTGLPTSVNCLPSHPSACPYSLPTSSAVPLPSSCPYSLGSHSSCQGSDGSTTPSTRLAFVDRPCHV